MSLSSPELVERITDELLSQLATKKFKEQNGYKEKVIDNLTIDIVHLTKRLEIEKHTIGVISDALNNQTNLYCRTSDLLEACLRENDKLREENAALAYKLAAVTAGAEPAKKG